MTLMVMLAPVFFLFELWQLVMGERYIGIKQIARGADPRQLGPSEVVSFIWSFSLFAYGLWMLGLLASPSTRIFAVCLIATTALGFAIRSRCKMMLVLVTLTLEGAVRMGLLGSMAAVAWRAR